MTWRLREFLAERGFRSASHISRTIAERTGRDLSVQAVCVLLNEPPKMLRIETMQLICDAFYCQLSDFCVVTPQVTTRAPARKPVARAQSKRAVKKAKPASPLNVANFFPDARTYLADTARQVKQ